MPIRWPTKSAGNCFPTLSCLTSEGTTSQQPLLDVAFQSRWKFLMVAVLLLMIEHITQRLLVDLTV